MLEDEDSRLLSNAELAHRIEQSSGDRVTEHYIRSRIEGVEYHIPTDTLTLCCLTLDNGFVVTGESACVDPSNFDEEVGQRIAYDNAFQKLWPLFGFLLAEQRHRTHAEGA